MKIFLDDMREAPAGYILCKTYDECIEALMDGDVDVLSLDHDIGSSDDMTGYSVCMWMVMNKTYPKEVYIHSANPVGMKNMVQLLDRYMPVENKIYTKLGDGFVPVYRNV